VSGVPSIAIAGRFQGAHLAPQEQQPRLLAEVDQFTREFGEALVPFDADAAKVWGEYVARPALKQKPRSYPDTQIAAIAMSRGLTVVTRNIKDFLEVPVLNPFED
jgi:toxin FitB